MSKQEGGETVVPAGLIELPQLTQDQRAYLDEIFNSSGRYDPDTIIGGPSARWDPDA